MNRTKGASNVPRAQANPAHTLRCTNTVLLLLSESVSPIYRPFHACSTSDYIKVHTHKTHTKHSPTPHIRPIMMSFQSNANAPITSTGTVPPPSAIGISGILPGQSAVNTTRILSLTGFSKELKTRDIQNIFVDFEDDRGGYRIKWLDDTGCLIVFSDPLTGRRPGTLIYIRMTE